MDSLTKKTVTTKRGFTYTYYVSPAAPGKPTLLLQHGFPDAADEWADLITAHLAPAGYGVIAPDQLGYAGTAKPADPAAYRMDGIAADLVDLLDAEDPALRVVALGHDWGSRSAQALHNLHPARVAGLVMVNTGHAPASAGGGGPPFDMDAILAQMEAVVGYAGWYWKFFVADDGAALLREHADVVFDALHAPQSWMSVFFTDGNMRKVVEARGEGFDLTRRPYATEAAKRAFVERMRRDGFEGPTCWYKSHVLGYQDGVGNPDNNVVDVPTLYIRYPGDPFCWKDNLVPSIQAGFLPHLTDVTLEGAHWGLLDDPKAFGEAVTEWLDKNYTT